MPGWYETTREPRESGRLGFVGIIQEQHPERCRLFLQWKRMSFPVLVDSFDLLDVAVVPVTVLIDERGIVRHFARAPDDGTLERFLATEYEPVEQSPRAMKPPDLETLGLRAQREPTVETLREYGEALFLWGGAERLDDAVAALEKAFLQNPEDGHSAFRVGVAYRARYDAGGSAEDFTRAVAGWTRALATDPNQYIWRRRLQQFGPRLDKPYPFYDWVAGARSEITARGETAVELSVEPRGAEIAQPARSFEAAEPSEGPDPDGRVHRDAGRLIRASATSVPPVLRPGGTARVHLEFRPRPGADAHWNNEARPMVVWLDPPDGWQVDSRQLALPLPPQPVSEEVRRVEVELRAPDRQSAAGSLGGYALYYVCQGVDGQCVFRRQDLKVPLSIK